MRHYDVLIVGAGLAGLRCAYFLAVQGVHVLLVDRKKALNQLVHTTGIFVRRTLEDFPLPEDCLGPVLRHVTLYSPARRKMTLESDHAEFRVGRMGRLYQRFLDSAIGSGVTWQAETCFVRSRPAGAKTVVRLEHKGREEDVSVSYLVGADGAMSRVARDLGLDQNRHWIVGVEEVLENVPLEGPPQLHCFLDPQLAPGYIAWLAHDGEEVHLGVGGYSNRFQPLTALEKFRQSLTSSFDFRHARTREQRGGRIPVGGVLKRIVSHRGLLVGDAAGAVSPLTAGGLDPALRLAALAAQVIYDYLQRGDEHALARYDGNRFRPRFASRCLMRRVFSAVRHRYLIELGFAALSSSWPLRQLARHVFFGRGSFPVEKDELALTRLVTARS